jgi:hypothetical protein
VKKILKVVKIGFYLIKYDILADKDGISDIFIPVTVPLPFVPGDPGDYINKGTATLCSQGSLHGIKY